MSAHPSIERAAAFVEHADRYARLGWALVRCDGKKPKGEGWQHTQPEPPELVAGKWSEWGRRWNVGVVCGPSGLAILDVDRDDSEAAVRELLGEPPQTPTVRTGRGRLQVYFRDPGGLEKIVRDGLELRVGGHQCVAPPSVHPDTGREYVWLPGREPWAIALAELPAPVLDFFGEARGPSGRATPIGEVIPLGARDNTLASLAGTMRRRGASEATILAALREENRKCQPPLDERELERIARSISRYPPSYHPSTNGAQGAEPEGEPVSEDSTVTLAVESWCQFSERAGERIPCLVSGLWPRGALGFISAPPKAGKTWLGLAFALSVATGQELFGRFAIPEPEPVLYIALEGHRAALRARVGCLARGLGADPDEALDRLHFAYKPRGLNLASPAWAATLIEQAAELDAGLIVVDVLRRAAAIDENKAAEFLTLCAYLAPLAEEGRSVALLHHFGKLSEINRDRTPPERMAGTGAMFGALDVGLFITGSQDHARRLRIHVESRDLAPPDPFGLELTGVGSGENGGFTYQDTCRIVEAEPPDEAQLKAPPREVATWIIEQGRRVKTAEVCERFDVTDDTLRDRRPSLESFGVRFVSDGRNSGYEAKPQGELDPPNPSTDRPPERSAHGGFGGANPHEAEVLPLYAESPESGRSEGAETADLQGLPDPPDLPLPIGSSPLPGPP